MVTCYFCFMTYKMSTFIAYFNNLLPCFFCFSNESVITVGSSTGSTEPILQSKKERPKHLSIGSNNLKNNITVSYLFIQVKIINSVGG